MLDSLNFIYGMKFLSLNKRGNFADLLLMSIVTSVIALVIATIGLSISENVESATGVSNTFLDLGQLLLPTVILFAILGTMAALAFYFRTGSR